MADTGGSAAWPVVVDAVVVCFAPEPARLTALLASLQGQVRQVWLVNNGAALACTEVLPRSCRLLHLGSNRGVGAAQNAGVACARAEGATHVLLSDQDSAFPAGYVAALLAALGRASAPAAGHGPTPAASQATGSAAVPVAAIGPVVFDRHRGECSPALVGGRWLGVLPGLFRRFALQGITEVAQLIASGMLVPLAAFDQIGPLREDLFIDWVDTEWCWRAIAHGWRVLQTPAVVLDHAIGRGAPSVLGRRPTVHPSVRNYTKLRNGLYLLCRQPGLPWAMRAYLLYMLPRMALIILLGAEDRRLECCVTVAALRDGLSGRLGPPPARLARRIAES